MISSINNFSKSDFFNRSVNQGNRTNAPNANFESIINGQNETVEKSAVERKKSIEEGTVIASLGCSELGQFSVTKPADFDASNPIYIVKHIRDGVEVETTVNINKMDPKNASLYEMQAFSAHFNDGCLLAFPHVSKIFSDAKATPSDKRDYSLALNEALDEALSQSLENQKEMGSYLTDLRKLVSITNKSTNDEDEDSKGKISDEEFKLFQSDLMSRARVLPPEILNGNRLEEFMEANVAKIVFEFGEDGSTRIKEGLSQADYARAKVALKDYEFWLSGGTLPK